MLSTRLDWDIGCLKNNCHLALLAITQNVLTYTTYARLPFGELPPSQITILVQTGELCRGRPWSANGKKGTKLLQKIVGVQCTPNKSDKTKNRKE